MSKKSPLRPSAVLWDGTETSVLLEGHPDDVAHEARRACLEPVEGDVGLPDGPHRGRVSVAPSRLVELGHALDLLAGVHWVAEIGVGTVHVAADTERSLAAARAAAGRVGGWLLREAGAPGLDGFGVSLPNDKLLARIKMAFDPTDKLASGRLPIRPTSESVSA